MKELSMTMCAEDGACLVITKHTKHRVEIEIVKDGDVSTISFNLSEFRQLNSLLANMLEARVEKETVVIDD